MIKIVLLTLIVCLVGCVKALPNYNAEDLDDDGNVCCIEELLFDFSGCLFLQNLTN